jgi:membrane fusion protein (multidrug efflux system)
MKSLVIGLFAVAGLCMGTTLLSGCETANASTVKEQDRSAERAAVNVVVAKIKEGPFDDWVSYPADFRGIEDANLIAPAQGGRVNAVLPIGSRVKAGESLCDIEREKYDVALKAAQVQVDLTKGELDRAIANVENGSIGRSAIDAADLAHQNARLALAAAKRADQDCRCEAPFDGVLVSRSIDRYQTVAPGTPTVRLSRLDRFEAIIAIPETEAFGLREGMKAELHLLQNPGRAYTGTIKSLDRAIDPHTRTATARIETVNSDGLLRPGMVGRVRILRRHLDAAIVVPTTALLRFQNGTSAMVVENGVARQRCLKITATADDRALVAEGLSASDTLIVSGAFQVSSGTRVHY